MNAIQKASRHKNELLRKREGTRGELIASFWYLESAYKQEREQLFTQSDSGRTRGKGLKLKEGKFRIDVKKNSLYLESSEEQE